MCDKCHMNAADVGSAWPRSLLVLDGRGSNNLCVQRREGLGNKQRKLRIILNAESVNLFTGMFLGASAADVCLCNKKCFECLSAKRAHVAIRIYELSYWIVYSVTAVMMCTELVNSVKRCSAVRSRAGVDRVVNWSMLNSLALFNMRNKTQHLFE